jgi:hypothetical protein
MQGGPGDRGRTSDYRHRVSAPDATEDFLFHLYRGSELLQDNRVHEAKEELEQALKLQPRDAKGQDLLAVVYFRLGLYPRAIEIYEELIHEFSRDAALTQNLSLCYLKTGQPEKARTLLENLVLAQPDHLRAWAYLGLVHERLGDYEKARAAFNRGEQPGMARRMDELLASGAPPRSLSVPPPSAHPADEAPRRESNRPAEAFHELEREVTLSGIPPIPRKDTVPPAPPPSERPAPNGPLASSDDAPPIVPIPHISIGPPPPLPPSSAAPSTPAEIVTLAALARSSQLTFPKDPGLSIHPTGLVLVHVESNFAARLSDVQLLAGEVQAFKHERMLRRMRNRTLDEPLGGADTPIVMFGGAGYLALGPRLGEQLVTFRMDGDILFVRESVLIGFESTLTYESGRLAAFQGDAVALVQLRGRGAVVLRARGPLLTTDVKSDRSIVFARETVVGWSGRLLPRELSTDEAVGGVSGLISFAGEGTVFASSGARLVGP